VAVIPPKFGMNVSYILVSTPLKNMKVSWDDYSQYMEKMFQATNQVFASSMPIVTYRFGAHLAGSFQFLQVDSWETLESSFGIRAVSLVLATEKQRSKRGNPIQT
jgi:hypothetical protein